MNRNFSDWLSTFRKSISSYDYYVDFDKVNKNVDSIKIKLNILNSLVGSKNIEQDFETLIKQYPETLNCVPILLAVRANEIFAMDEDGEYTYDFRRANYSIEQYKIFMRKTGLFDLISSHIINNLVDYVTGVETGLDSNTRKSRGGKAMEALVKKYIEKAGFKKDVDYFEQMKTSKIEEKWGINLSALSNNGKMEKQFDFVIKTTDAIYGVEVNFYAQQGSKPNETARSYKTIALEAKNIKGFEFVWFTDGNGWMPSRNNLEETFDILENIYNIKDLEDGIAERIFK